MNCSRCDEYVLGGEHECYATYESIETIEHEAGENEYFDANEPTKTKETAVWDQNATLALLSLYEAKMDMLNHPKKRSKIWEAIATALQQDFGIKMSTDQVRWKMNALTKKYKECVDNNSKSGRNPMTFKWFDQMDEIFNQGKDAVTSHSFSSKFVHVGSKPSTSFTKEVCSKSSTLSMKEVYSKSSTSSVKEIRSQFPTTSTSTSITHNSDTLLENRSSKNSKNISTSSGSMFNKKIKSKDSSYESNTNIARDKVALENQWLQYMKMKIERDKVSDESQASTLEQKKEILKLKRKNVALKEEAIKQRKEYFTAKLREKENMHAEIITIENKKYKLLQKLLKVNSSDSE